MSHPSERRAVAAPLGKKHAKSRWRLSNADLGLMTWLRPYAADLLGKL